MLGMGGFVWPMVAALMLLSLLRREHVVAPKGFLVWVGFVAWMFATATQLDSIGRAIGFSYRAAIYLSATIVLLYVFNASHDVLPTEKVVRVLAIFWMIVVVGGYLGLLFPFFSFRSPVEAALPGFVVSNDFVREMVHPAFAQVQEFLGYPTPRPSAPFVYTNDWGGNFALLVPFVMIAWSSPISRRFKMLLMGFAVAAVVPLILSLNRGLWLSLSVGLVYAAVRMALRGRERPLIGILAVIVLITGAVFLTPLHGVITDRLATPHSNERRVSLYDEALRGVAESPLFGYGAPRPSKWNPNAPSVGTQGSIWLVLFSHGFLGAALFVGWWGYCFWTLRRASDPMGFWCHVLLVILMVQWPVWRTRSAGRSRTWRRRSHPGAACSRSPCCRTRAARRRSSRPAGVASPARPSVRSTTRCPNRRASGGRRSAPSSGSGWTGSSAWIAPPSRARSAHRRRRCSNTSSGSSAGPSRSPSPSSRSRARTASPCSRSSTRADAGSASRRSGGTT
jgi:O-antigen ligase